MVGLILNAEQVRSAPPEVRHWLKSLLEAELGGSSQPEHGAEDVRTAIAACSLDDARAVLDRIRNDYLATQVFFELGRETPRAVRPNHLHRVTVLDIARHTRLANLQHLGTCLDAIATAFREARGDPGATLFAFDGRGAIYIHEITQRSILQLWHELVLGQRSEQPIGETGQGLAGTGTPAAAE